VRCFTNLAAAVTDDWHRSYNVVFPYVPWAYNMVSKNAPPTNREFSGWFHPDRANTTHYIPQLLKSGLETTKKRLTKKSLPLQDEFIELNDVEIGKTVDLFQQLGYEVIIPEHRFGKSLLVERNAR
jgi:hypothetical protein